MMMFEYKVRAKHKLGFKKFKLYATTDIEEFFNRNNIDYVRNMTDTVEHRLLREIERLNNIINELEKTFKRDLESILDFEEKNPGAILSRFPEYYLEQLQELKGGKISSDF